MGIDVLDHPEHRDGFCHGALGRVALGGTTERFDLPGTVVEPSVAFGRAAGPVGLLGLEPFERRDALERGLVLSVAQVRERLVAQRRYLCLLLALLHCETTRKIRPLSL
jgi:hypothetical protein